MARKKKQNRPHDNRGSAAHPPLLGLDPILLEHERHHEALERLSVSALADGDHDTALRLIDRRCRIPPLAEAHHYTLRGEASYCTGDRRWAISDLEQSLSMAPDNLPANRRMLAWGDGRRKIEAARNLVRNERDFGVLAAATSALRDAGERALASIDHTDSRVTGWAAWRGRSALKLTIMDDDGLDLTLTVSPDPRHPLHGILGNATSFEIERPASFAPQTISVSVGKRIVCEISARPNRQAPQQLPPRLPSRKRSGTPDGRGEAKADESLGPNRGNSAIQGRSRQTAIIVPVYSDYEATKLCLDGLMTELKQLPRSRAILVDDASPDARIRSYLAALAERPHVELIRNHRNLGFVRSVNRAIVEAGDCDVLLLNADTVLPPGSIGRLQAAAYSEPGIGTATPFSNNGEIMSFPVANKPNPLGSPDAIQSLDAAAAVANAGRLVDIPNGIGFCLYITRACLNAVGLFSELYYRGYFEEVDLCLRARERGFRNVCASSVYVGHAGGRSFVSERQSLIVRNLMLIEQRFPKYRAECAAYLLADPLRPSRASLERAIAPSSTGGILLISGAGTLKAVAQARAAAHHLQGLPSLIMEVQPRSFGSNIRFTDPSKGIPQSIEFKLELAEGRAALTKYIEQGRPSRMEIVDPAQVPPALLDLLATFDIPLDLLIADAGLKCARGSFIGRDGGVCGAVGSARRDCIDGCDSGCKALKTRRARWQEIVARADRILAPTPRAADFARNFLVDRPVIELPESKVMEGLEQIPSRSSTLGFVAAGENSGDYRLMDGLARALHLIRPDVPIIVIGRTVHDLALMRIANVFVTGPVESEEFERVLRQYRIAALFMATRRPLFGHPMMTCGAVPGFPTAFFDWSFGRIAARRRDLALDPRASVDEVAANLAAWAPKQQHGR
jgi:GT2 family glycosyltransferase